MDDIKQAKKKSLMRELYREQNLIELGSRLEEYPSNRIATCLFRNSFG